MNRRTLNIISLLILTFVIFALAVYAERKDKVICDFCKEEIKTQYIEYEGKKYHPIHFQCDQCGTVIGHVKFLVKNGKKYCEDCYEKLFADRCEICGEIIKGGFTVFNGKKYHRTCYNNNLASKCAASGHIIKGEYLKDFWGNIYHKTCEDEYDQCQYCGRFISERTTGGGEEYDDGRHVCNLCMEQTVSSNKEALGLLEEARDKLAIAGIYVTEKITLHLIDRDELHKISGIDSDDASGLSKCLKPDITARDQNSKYDIYLLEGMPRLSFIFAAAHELMHVWQYKNGKWNNNEALSEGSSNFAAYMVMKHYDEPYAKYLIDNVNKSENEVYGYGYQRVKKFVNDNGVEEWLELLKNSVNFPQGY